MSLLESEFPCLTALSGASHLDFISLDRSLEHNLGVAARGCKVNLIARNLTLLQSHFPLRTCHRASKFVAIDLEHESCSHCLTARGHLTSPLSGHIRGQHREGENSERETNEEHFLKHAFSPVMLINRPDDSYCLCWSYSNTTDIIVCRQRITDQKS